MNISACRSSRSIYSKVPPLGVPPPSLASQDTATTGRGPRFQTQAKATSVLPTEQMVKYSQKENIRQYAYWAKNWIGSPVFFPVLIIQVKIKETWLTKHTPLTE